MERRTRRSREETRASIMAKAEELFRRYGSGKTTVADIAKELGMSSANVYKFFPSKDAIVEAAAAQSVEQLKETILASVGLRGTFAQRLEWLTFAWIRHSQTLLQNEPQFHKLFIAAVEQNWSCVRQFHDFLAGVVTGLLVDARTAGEVAVDDPAAAAKAILDALRGMTHPILLLQMGDDGIDARARALVQLLAQALAIRQPAA